MCCTGLFRQYACGGLEMVACFLGVAWIYGNFQSDPAPGRNWDLGGEGRSSIGGRSVSVKPCWIGSAWAELVPFIQFDWEPKMVLVDGLD